MYILCVLCSRTGGVFEVFHGLQLGIDDRRQSLVTPVPNETLRLMHESSRHTGVEVSFVMCTD